MCVRAFELQQGRAMVVTEFSIVNHALTGAQLVCPLVAAAARNSDVGTCCWQDMFCHHPSSHRHDMIMVQRGGIVHDYNHRNCTRPSQSSVPALSKLWRADNRCYWHPRQQCCDITQSIYDP